VLALVLAALICAPLGAKAADLVVWWQKGFYAQEDEAVREIVAAFEQQTGKQVELVQPTLEELFDMPWAALAAGEPPDFLFGTNVSWQQWAYDDQLVDLEIVLGPVLDLFDSDIVEAATLLNGRTGRRALHGLPMGRRSIHLHVWNSLF
jgi:multiple sugar transport system substrate-binding protein